MAQQGRDGGQRSVLYALLAIAALGGLSIALLTFTNGDAPKTVDKSRVVASTTPVPSGAAADQLRTQCDTVVGELKPIADFLVRGLGSVPAGAPKPVGTEQVSCSLGTNGGTSVFVASRFVGTSAGAMGQAIEAAGWSNTHSDTTSGLPETLYTRSGQTQIVVVDLGGGQVIVVYS